MATKTPIIQRKIIIEPTYLSHLQPPMGMNTRRMTTKLKSNPNKQKIIDALAGISILSIPTRRPDIPTPRSIFNKGPPMHAARAINGYPIRVITIQETKSPTELPKAKTVMPSAEGLI